MFAIALLLGCPAKEEPTSAPPAEDTTVTESTATDTGTDSGTPATASTADTGSGSTAASGATATTGDSGMVLPWLVGTTYAFDPDTLDLTALPAADKFLPIGEVTVVMEVVDQVGTDLTLRVAFADADGNQAMCSPTTDLEADASGAPFVVAGPTDMSFEYAGAPLHVEQASLELEFNAAWTRVRDSSFQGALRAAPLADAFFGPKTGAGGSAVCDLITAITGRTCIPCPSTTTDPHCLAYRSEATEADEVTGGSVVERTQADILADPACN